MAIDTITLVNSFLGNSVALALALLYVGREWIVARNQDAIERNAEIRRSRLETKREACLEALRVVDAYFSQQKWTHGNIVISPERQTLDVAQARDCYNKLALTCDDPEIVTLYLAALGMRTATEPARQIPADIIADLRNRMRKELGFGKEVNLPRDMAWIATLQRAAGVVND